METEVQRSLERQWRRIEIISEGSEDEDIADERKVEILRGKRDAGSPGGRSQAPVERKARPLLAESELNPQLEARTNEQQETYQDGNRPLPLSSWM